MQAPSFIPPQPSDFPLQAPAYPAAIRTESLFQGHQEILINHKGEHYRLRITRSGKLILTK